MFKDMDSQALMGSEVFRNYLNITEASSQDAAKQDAEMGKNALKDFEEFQKRVNASPVLKDNFKKLQHRFINDPDYRTSVNQDFVQGVLLLKFED